MLLFFLFILGLVIGSFLNVLIDRLPKDQSIFGRSYCDHCHKQLEERDLIPLVSYFLLKGKCRNCGKKISAFYPLVEILTAATFVLVFLYAPTNEIIGRLLYIGFFSALIVVFFSDLKYQVIPDEILIALLAFSASIFLFEGKSLYFMGLRILDGVGVMLPILIIFFLTKRKGIGLADAKLALILGFFLGFWGGLASLYLAFVAGAIYGLSLILLKKKKWKSKIAFGPFLALGGAIVIFWPSVIFNFFRYFVVFW